MPLQNYIFVSHSSKNADFVKELVDHLEQENYSVWMGSEHIRPSNSFPEQIEDAIDKCSVFLLVNSFEAKESPWVKGEWKRFIESQSKRLLIPVCIDNAPLPLPIAPIQYVDALNKSSEVWKKEISELLREYFLIPQTVPVQDGPFTMGNPYSLRMPSNWDQHAGRDENPQHEVPVQNFEIGIYAITVSQFRDFIKDGGYTKDEYWTLSGLTWRDKNAINKPDDWDDATSDDLPVTGVSWYEATAYCRWLSKRTERQYSLPTEAEWEKAARGIDKRRWPWGNTWISSLVSAMNVHDGPISVYSHPEGKSPFACIQMAGNVYEWCSSLYFPYPYKPDDGREDTDVEGQRVLRGGYWASDAPTVRCAHRYCALPEARVSACGFRVKLK